MLGDPRRPRVSAQTLFRSHGGRGDGGDGSEGRAVLVPQQRWGGVVLQSKVRAAADDGEGLHGPHLAGHQRHDGMPQLARLDALLLGDDLASGGLGVKVGGGLHGHAARADL